ncbi:hypothetical protein ACFL09_05870 [Planctomycetota bacterium]
MSHRSQVLVGGVVVALVAALLVGGVTRSPVAYSQESAGAGRTARFALVTGIAGNTPNTQTMYLVDETNELLFAFEYSARGKPTESMDFRGIVDLRKYAKRGLELRANAEKKDKKGKKKRPSTRTRASRE